MLRLTSSQYHAFAQGALTRFIERLSERLPEQWPEDSKRLGLERVRSAAETAVKQAMQLGFVTEADVARFVHLAFAFRSMTFHELPWAEAIMRDAGLQPRVRMNRLFEAGIAALRAAEMRK
jgi:hypothetical protein